MCFFFFSLAVYEVVRNSYSVSIPSPSATAGSESSASSRPVASESSTTIAYRNNYRLVNCFKTTTLSGRINLNSNNIRLTVIRRYVRAVFTTWRRVDLSLVAFVLFGPFRRRAIVISKCDRSVPFLSR